MHSLVKEIERFVVHFLAIVQIDKFCIFLNNNEHQLERKPLANYLSCSQLFLNLRYLTPIRHSTERPQQARSYNKVGLE